ncbi:major facilitator superfamily transporter, partial [Aureobasidium melanogenum]
MPLSRPSSPVSVLDKEKAVEHIESAPVESTYLEGFPLLRDKSDGELAVLNKKVLKKLDWNYLDRINVSNARLAGMQADLGMNDVMWSTGISMFYVGYIISQIPANVIVAKGNPRILLPCCMLAWSAVTICMPAMKSGWSFCVCRFLVGFTEGPFLPAVSLMTSSWYTKHESPLRMGIWHAGNIISNVISGLLAAAILTNMDGIANLHAWQWFIILEGIVSIMVALTGFWLLPNWPNNTGTYFFTPEESEMAQWRVLVSAGGVSEDDEGDYWGGVSQALRDPFTWMFASLHFALIIAQSFKDFFPSIMATLGFSKVVTYLIQAPPYVIAYFVTLGISWSSGRHLEHCWHIIGSIAVCLVGAIIMISTFNTGARYSALVLLCSGPFVGLNIQISWETTVVPRPRTKRAALIAIANCVSSVSHWFSPYFFLTSQEPRYQTGGGVIIAGCGMTILSCLVTRWWCIRKNKALDKKEAETGEVNSWRFAT